ncbi:MAG: hypothetical protein COA36_08150 [Desulfotalea sp.]|nr:MAG: hypothetical protein COA36_08150 [Desulfotalea sp.]
MKVFIIAVLLFTACPLQAKEIAGVIVQEVVTTESGADMALNGAGIRSKFFVDIYIAELYMEQPSADVGEILAASGGRRLVMYFLYKEVSKKKLVAGWNEGFSGNSTSENVAVLQPRIDSFNAMFSEVKRGERIVLDYVPGKGTTVTVAGVEKGVIQGKDFNDALLRIWLGQNPVNKKLKKQLLSYGE